jgi:hypothetical protein
LIDTSLEGAIRGARPDEQERLARLSDQLRQLLRASGRFSLVDITPIASEAQASNLQACGGCDIQLARRIGAELAHAAAVTLHPGIGKGEWQSESDRGPLFFPSK